VDTHDWPVFNKLGLTPREDAQVKSIEEAKDGFSVPDLQSIWYYLRNHPTVSDATRGEVHRGVEWNVPVRENAHILLSHEAKDGYKLGIPPSKKTEFYSFQCPALKHLCILPKYRRRGFNHPWNRPKVIMNGRRKGRYPWRVAAFADLEGLICYHTFLGLWPVAELSPTVLSAVINGPLASAYISTHTVGRDVPGGVVKKIPLPRLDAGLTARIERLVGEYLELVQGNVRAPHPERTAERVLLEIDATVLEGYDLSPRLERCLLDYFNGHGERRPVNHAFADYFPVDFRPCFSLADYISAEFRLSAVEEFIKRYEKPPEHVLRAIRHAGGVDQE
jgi:hypothetical protein